MLARIFVAIGGLIVLALLAALVGPYFINWTSYRSDFERQASAILGRSVKVKGEAVARILPFPSVTFKNVEVAGVASTPPTTVDEFSMDAELAPFLSGNILIFDMRLVRPKTTVHVAADGVVTWAADPSTPVDARHIALERMTISDGEIRLLVDGEAEHRIADVDATVSARTLAGPWRADGTLTADGRPIAINVSTGSIDAEGMRIKLRLDPGGSDYGIDLEGLASMSGQKLVYGGDVRIAQKPPAAAELRGADGKPIPSMPGNRITGKFKLDHQQLAVDEFRFETGSIEDPYVANGKATIRFGKKPSFLVEAAGSQLQLTETDAGPGQSNATLAARLDQLQAILADLPRPDIPGSIDLKLPALVAGETAIRDVTIQASTVASGWNIAKLAATMPGRTTLEASGLLTSGPDIGFKGKALLAIGQPSGFAAWLATDIDAPVRRLARAGVSADVTLTRNVQSFGNIELALGAARFQGRLVRTAADGQTPVVDAELQGGAVSAEEASALRAIFVSDKWESRAKDQNLTLAIKAGPVGDAPLSIGEVDLALRAAGDAIDIDRLNLTDVASATLAATGRVQSFSTTPRLKLDATVLAEDLAPLVELGARLAPDAPLLTQLANSAALHPDLLTDARLDLLADLASAGGQQGKMDLTVKGGFGGGQIDGRISAAGNRTNLRDALVNLDMKLANPSGASLLALTGAPVLPLDVAGAAKLELNARGALRTGVSADALITADDGSSVSFAGQASAPEQSLELKGAVKLNAKDIEPWMMTVGLPMLGITPGLGEGTPISLEGDLAYNQQHASLGSMIGAIDGVPLRGDIVTDLSAVPPKVTGKVEAEAISLDTFARAVFGPEAITGGDAWSGQPVAQKVATPFALDLDLTAGKISAGNAPAATAAHMALKLDDSGLTINNLAADLLGGRLTGALEFRNNGGNGLASVQYQLTGANLGEALLAAGEPASTLTAIADISGSLSGSGKSAAAIVSSLAGAGAISMKDLTIAGLNPGAFQSLLAGADKAGRDVNAANVAQFAPAAILKGVFPVGNAETTYTVAGGVARLAPQSFASTGARLESEARLDLSTAALEGAGTLTYDPGEDAMVGADPQAGFTLGGALGKATFALDTEPLTQFLTQRALEIEQARVEQMQALLLEKQRLRREARYFGDLQASRDKAEAERRAAEEARAAQEEEARQAAIKNLAEEAARATAEAAKAEAARKAKLERDKAQAEKAKAQAEKEKTEAAKKAAAPKPPERAPSAPDPAQTPPKAQQGNGAQQGTGGAFPPPPGAFPPAPDLGQPAGSLQ